jgi:hypothetical protein
VGAQRHLTVAERVTLNAAGTAQAQFSPASEDWLILVTTVSTVQAAATDSEPTVYTYRSGVSPSNLIDSTYSGFSATSDTRVMLAAGETLIVVWTDGEPGAAGTVRLEGVTYPPGGAIAAYGGG